MSEPVAADRRLHPSSLAMRFVKNVPQFALGLPALISYSSDAGTPLVFALVAAGAGFALAAAWLSWRRFRYGVGEADIVIESGVLQRKRRSIPFDRVQDIEIEQGLLARLFGTVTVRIETGGGGKDEGRLDAVTPAEAHRLRDIVRGRRAAGDPAAAVAVEEEPLLFAMSLKRLLFAGLFNFSLLFLAAVGFAFENLQPYFDRLGIDPFELFGLARGAGTAVIVASALALAALLLLLGMITGIVRTVMTDYGFRLWRARAGLRRKRGLFTRSETVIPLTRIQLAVLRSGLVGRALGWFTLEYQTLNADAAKAGHQAAAPFARLGEIEPILAETGHSGLPPAEDYVRVSRLSVARRSAHFLLPIVPVSIAVSFAFEVALLIVPLVLALIPLLMVVAVLQWKRHRFAVTDRAILISNGLFDQRLWIIPFERAQTISISRSPLQRWLGLASVDVDTAGAGVFNYPVIADLDPESADALGDRLLQLHKSARLARRRDVQYPE